MSSNVQKPSSSLVTDLGNNPAVQSALSAIIAQLLTALPGLIAGIFTKKPKVLVTVPTPAPVQIDEDFPDDTIPEPKAGRTVVSVRLKLARAQYNKQRFPDQYVGGKDGLYSPSELRAIESGGSALAYGSKFWLDLTAYDADDREFLRPAVLAFDLAYKTEHHAGDAFIAGDGGVDGVFNPYDANDTNEVGNGISAWITSLGFLHQMKAHREGTYECYGSVGGVESNHFNLKVS